MTELPRWTYSGAVRATGNLALLESELHTGRVAASELGYVDEPESIDVIDAMLVEDGGQLVSADEAAEMGRDFIATHTQFVMTWAAQA
jgi:hypothetical protein